MVAGEQWWEYSTWNTEENWLSNSYDYEKRSYSGEDDAEVLQTEADLLNEDPPVQLNSHD